MFAPRLCSPLPALCPAYPLRICPESTERPFNRHQYFFLQDSYFSDFSTVCLKRVDKTRRIWGSGGSGKTLKENVPGARLRRRQSGFCHHRTSGPKSTSSDVHEGGRVRGEMFVATPSSKWRLALLRGYGLINAAAGGYASVGICCPKRLEDRLSGMFLIRSHAESAPEILQGPPRSMTPQRRW